MKFTNVKQLIIKFMGGGLINFPTRFLRWVKINGDSDGSDDGGSGGGGSSDSIIDAISNFSIKIKKDKSGFFSSTGEPVSGVDYVDSYYSKEQQPESLGELTPIEEYFDISNMDVFVALCNLVKSNDSIAFSYNYNNEVELQLSKSDLLSGYSNEGCIKIYRTTGYNQEKGDYRDECVCIHHGEYGDASTYYPRIYIFVDSSDPTKFYAKPSE